MFVSQGAGTASRIDAVREDGGHCTAHDTNVIAKVQASNGHARLCRRMRPEYGINPSPLGRVWHAPRHGYVSVEATCSQSQLPLDPQPDSFDMQDLTDTQCSFTASVMRMHNRALSDVFIQQGVQYGCDPPSVAQ